MTEKKEAPESKWAPWLRTLATFVLTAVGTSGVWVWQIASTYTKSQMEMAAVKAQLEEGKALRLQLTAALSAHISEENKATQTFKDENNKAHEEIKLQLGTVCETVKWLKEDRQREKKELTLNKEIGQ